MQLTISHKTAYTYDAPVPYALQQVRLTPKSRPAQTVLAWETEITGGKIEARFTDQHSNEVMLVSFSEGTTGITLTSSGKVETKDTSGVTGDHQGHMPLWLFKRSTAKTAAGPGIEKLVRDLGDDHSSQLNQLHGLSLNIYKHVRYETGQTDSSTTAEEALEAGHGVCQDHAHIFIGAARLLGFPARYVSGYLMMNDREEQDATHAWAEAFIEGLGWVGFDISNGISPDERYVRIATGLDYNEAAPISGLTAGIGRESLSVMLKVQQQ